MTTNILVIDDDPTDVLFLKRAFEEIKSDTALHHVEHGHNVLDELDNRPIDLILLDIKMPGTDGFEVLQIIRGDVAGRVTPVIMLSSSSADEDVKRSYIRGANSYAEKPSTRDGYRAFAEAFTGFWIKTAVTPAV